MKEVFEKIVDSLKERSGEYNSHIRLHGKPEEMRTCEAIEIVNQVVAETISKMESVGWIPCSDRLPERNKEVLCWAKSTAGGSDCCFVGSCDNGFWFLQSAIGTLSYPTQYEVVAWCELPEPFKQEGV